MEKASNKHRSVIAICFHLEQGKSNGFKLVVDVAYPSAILHF